jgi:predicted ArsR family transcriptional regulator
LITGEKIKILEKKTIFTKLFVYKKRFVYQDNIKGVIVRDVNLIEDVDKAGELLKPIRLEILSLLDEPRTCPDLARRLGVTTQKVNYHIKVLQESGLVRLVEERRNRGIMEGVYQADARSYWFSPRLVSLLGGRRKSRDQASLEYLLGMAEDLQIETGRLAKKTDAARIPSLGLNARIRLRDAEDRAAFMEELKDLFQKLARKYGSTEQDTSARDEGRFRLMLACYPEVADRKDNINRSGE